MADPFAPRIEALLPKANANNPQMSISDQELDLYQLRQDAYAEMEAMPKPTSLAESKERLYKTRELQRTIQEIETELDRRLTRLEVPASDLKKHHAQVAAGGFVKGLVGLPAAVSDLGMAGVEALTGYPQGPSLQQSMAKSFPTPINPAEQRTDMLMQLPGAGAVNTLKTGGGMLMKWLQGLAAETGGAAGGAVGQELGGTPGAIIGSILGGGVTQSATSASSWDKRAISKEATAGLAPGAPATMRREIAEATAEGVSGITPAQTSAGTDSMRSLENWTAAMPDSRIRRMQQTQPAQAMQMDVLKQLPGEVMDPQLLARMGQKVAGAELKRIKDIANAAHKFALKGKRATPEQIASVDKGLQGLLQDSRFRDIEGFQGYVAELRRKLYEPVLEPQLVGGGTRKVDTGVLDAAGNAISREEKLLTRVEEVETMQPITDPDRVSTIMQGVVPEYKQVGAGATVSVPLKLSNSQRRELKDVYTSNIPAMAQADRVSQTAYRVGEHGVKKSKDELGAWSGARGATDATSSPMGRLQYMFDRGIDPKLPNSQNPILRFAAQTKAIPEAQQFLASAVKTKVSGILADSGDDISAKFSKLADPKTRKTIQSGYEGIAIQQGKTAAEARQASIGLSKFFKVLELVERRAKTGRNLPVPSKGSPAEGLITEGAAAAQYAPRASHFFWFKVPNKILGEYSRKWVDQTLATPEGIEQMIKFSKQSVGTDFAQGALLGLIGRDLTEETIQQNKSSQK